MFIIGNLKCKLEDPVQRLILGTIRFLRTSGRLVHMEYKISLLQVSFLSGPISFKVFYIMVKLFYNRMADKSEHFLATADVV